MGSIALEMITALASSRSAMWRMNSTPSIPGISRSHTITSGGPERAIASSAAWPSAASVIVPTPSPRSSCTAVRRWKSWSSTTSIEYAARPPAAVSRAAATGTLASASRYTDSVAADGRTPSSEASTALQCSYAATAPAWSPPSPSTRIRSWCAGSLNGSARTSRSAAAAAACRSPACACARTCSSRAPVWIEFSSPRTRSTHSPSWWGRNGSRASAPARSACAAARAGMPPASCSRAATSAERASSRSTITPGGSRS